MPVTDQGILTGRYCLIPRTLVFLTNEDYVLLINGSPDKRLWPNLYNGIGGHIKRGEDITTAAKRELLEETLIDVVELRLVGFITIDTDQDFGIGIYVFRGESQNRITHSTKEGKTEWVPIEKLQSIALVEDLQTLLPMILDKDPLSPPFAAHYTYNEEGKLYISIS